MARESAFAKAAADKSSYGGAYFAKATKARLVRLERGQSRIIAYPMAIAPRQRLGKSEFAGLSGASLLWYLTGEAKGLASRSGFLTGVAWKYEDALTLPCAL